MRFGPTPLEEAEGAILAHTLRLDGRTLKKGLRLGPEEIALLREAGHHTVQAARLDPGDLPEDDAARAVAQAVAGPGVAVGDPFTGRCNLRAEAAGLVELDAEAVRALNGVDEGITLATLPPDTPVFPRTLVATAKIIPFAVPSRTLDAAVAAASGPGDGAVLRVHPFRRHRASLVLTVLPGLPEALLEKGEAALRARVEEAGSTLDRVDRVPHDVDALARVLGEHLDGGYDPVLVLGASAVVDRGDVVPTALEWAGGRVDHFGLPVDPGNLLLLGRRDRTRVVGVPGCARSPKPSGFDRVLHRLLAGLPVTRETIADMGVGGLMKEIAARPQPRGEPGGGAPGLGGRVAAVVLAAGRSTRMGAANKLLEAVDGVPLVVRVVDTILEAPVSPVVVVTGHDGTAVEDAVTGRPVTLVRNPAHAEGMGRSLARGVAALEDIGEDTVDPAGVLVVLGDMPALRPTTVEALLDAFGASGGVAPCVPVHGGRRGHPVLFPGRLLPELRALGGDVGARPVLDAHADDVVEVPVDDPGVLLDLDTRDALEAYRAGEGDG